MAAATTIVYSFNSRLLQQLLNNKPIGISTIMLMDFLLLTNSKINMDMLNVLSNT